MCLHLVFETYKYKLIDLGGEINHIPTPSPPNDDGRAFFGTAPSPETNPTLPEALGSRLAAKYRSPTRSLLSAAGKTRIKPPPVMLRYNGGDMDDDDLFTDLDSGSDGDDIFILNTGTF